MVSLAHIVTKLKTFIQTETPSFTLYDLPLSIIILLFKLLTLNCCLFLNTYIFYLTYFPFWLIQYPTQIFITQLDSVLPFTLATLQGKLSPVDMYKWGTSRGSTVCSVYSSYSHYHAHNFVTSDWHLLGRVVPRQVKKGAPCEEDLVPKMLLCISADNLY